MTLQFYPRDTVLARVLAVVTVCLSVTSRYCIETAARIEPIFFANRFPRSMLQIRISPKVRVLHSGTLSQSLQSGRRKCSHGTPTVGECDINSEAVGMLFTVPGGDGKCNLQSKTIADCWSHLTSSCEYSAMVDWAWGSVARVSSALADIFVANNSREHQ